MKVVNVANGTDGLELAPAALRGTAKASVSPRALGAAGGAAAWRPGHGPCGRPTRRWRLDHRAEHIGRRSGYAAQSNGVQLSRYWVPAERRETRSNGQRIWHGRLEGTRWQRG